MKISRLTISLGLAAVVSLFGLIEANASPFSMFFLADDLGNRVTGTAPDASEWEVDGGGDSGDSGGGDSGADSGGGDSAGGDSGADSGGGDSAGDSGKSNNGHGNNEDGVDSSNPGQGNGGPNGAPDESCPEGGECVDDEASNSNGGGKKKKK